MNSVFDDYYNIAKRVEDAFLEIDSDVCAELRNSNYSYIELWREAAELQKTYSVISEIIEDDNGEIMLSAKEHTALIRFLKLKTSMENIERKQIYFRGHTDNFAYLKKIKAI